MKINIIFSQNHILVNDFLEKGKRLENDLLKWTLRIIREYNIKPKRKFGQNYIISREMINRILEAAEIKPNEVILEIGAGIGTLTLRLSKLAKKVIVIEKDRNAVKALSKILEKEKNIEIIEGDALKINFPSVDKIVSNLPFSISTPITFKILEADFKLAVLTYQKEVANRLLAKTGDKDYSRLSVAMSLMAEVEKIGDFPPDCFYPKPKVFTTVVRIRKKKHNIDWKTLEDVLRILFSQRRRKLKVALYTYCKINKMNYNELISLVDRELLERRVFEIKPEEFIHLSNLIKNKSEGNKPNGEKNNNLSRGL
jgi:16S rRNA (adenine1518-N6/adenine1519-N6)-dimethyltransferase